MYSRDIYPKIPPRTRDDKGFIHRLERTVEDTEKRDKQEKSSQVSYISKPQYYDDRAFETIKRLTSQKDAVLTLDEMRVMFSLDEELGKSRYEGVVGEQGE